MRPSLAHPTVHTPWRCHPHQQVLARRSQCHHWPHSPNAGQAAWQPHLSYTRPDRTWPTGMPYCGTQASTETYFQLTSKAYISAPVLFGGTLTDLHSHGLTPDLPTHYCPSVVTFNSYCDSSVGPLSHKIDHTIIGKKEHSTDSLWLQFV